MQASEKGYGMLDHYRYFGGVDRVEIEKNLQRSAMFIRVGEWGYAREACSRLCAVSGFQYRVSNLRHYVQTTGVGFGVTPEKWISIMCHVERLYLVALVETDEVDQEVKVLGVEWEWAGQRGYPRIVITGVTMVSDKARELIKSKDGDKLWQAKMF